MKITNQRSYTLVIGGQRAEPGESIDVPSDVGKQAVKQPDNWSAAKSTKKSTAADDGAQKES